VDSKPRILMYSHDSYGLGHLRRTLALAKAKVQEALDRLMAGKTSLVITHDLHAVAGADLILVLENGRIVEHGSHDKLMAQSQHYRQLYELKRGRHEQRVRER
jgi:ATP-binding cassette, subfamily B, bacterial